MELKGPLGWYSHVPQITKYFSASSTMRGGGGNIRAGQYTSRWKQIQRNSDTFGGSRRPPISTQFMKTTSELQLWIYSYFCKEEMSWILLQILKGANKLIYGKTTVLWF